MEQPDSTWDRSTVADPAAARFLLDPDRLRFLRPFMRSEQSTSAAAEALGVAVKTMAYRVKRMEALGLLRCTGERRRPGRPVRLYRAPRTLFIPFAVVPQGDLEEMVEALLRTPQRQLVAGLVRSLADGERDLHRWGWRLALDAEERLSIRPASNARGDEQLFQKLLTDEGPAVYVGNVPLRLDHAAAKALQRELLALVERYDGRDGPDTYLLTLGLAPLPRE